MRWRSVTLLAAGPQEFPVQPQADQSPGSGCPSVRSTPTPPRPPCSYRNSQRCSVQSLSRHAGWNQGSQLAADLSPDPGRPCRASFPSVALQRIISDSASSSGQPNRFITVRAASAMVDLWPRDRTERTSVRLPGCPTPRGAATVVRRASGASILEGEEHVVFGQNVRAVRRSAGQPLGCATAVRM